MKKIFISYDIKDKKKVTELCEYLEMNGIELFLVPDSIPEDETYATAVPKAIKDCVALLLVISASSQESSWIPKEVETAIENKKTIIPFQVDDCKINDTFHFYLGNSEIINGTKTSIEAYDEAVIRIKGKVKEERKEPIKEQKESSKEEPKTTNQKPENGIGKYIYPSGAVYEGEWEDHRRCGFGILTTKEGYNFYGIFNDNKAERGIFVMDSTDYKTAYYKSDEEFYVDRSPKEKLINILEFYGECKKKYPNGDVYTGRTFLGMKNDEGSVEYANGDYYLRCWDNDKKEGYGFQLYADKSKYIGFWKKDLKEGLGIQVSKEGDVFLGIFKQNIGIVGITRSADGELKADQKYYETKKKENIQVKGDSSAFDIFNSVEYNTILQETIGNNMVGMTKKETKDPCPLCHGYGKTVRIEDIIGDRVNKFIKCPKCLGKGKRQ